MADEPVDAARWRQVRELIPIAATLDLGPVRNAATVILFACEAEVARRLKATPGTTRADILRAASVDWLSDEARARLFDERQ